MLVSTRAGETEVFPDKECQGTPDVSAVYSSERTEAEPCCVTGEDRHAEIETTGEGKVFTQISLK